MSKATTAQKIIVLDRIIEDINMDVKDMEGAPFNGKVVAQHFGYLRAQVERIAKILKQELEEKPDDSTQNS